MPLCGGARDEPPGEVAADGTRADEEPAANGERERRLRPRLQRADALPRALDAAAHGAVEDAAAGDLEVREARPVEDLGEARRSAVGMRPASGSWLRTRIDVSTRRGTAGTLPASRRTIHEWAEPPALSLARAALRFREQARAASPQRGALEPYAHCFVALCLAFHHAGVSG